MKFVLFGIMLALVTVQPPDPDYDPDGHLKSEHQIPAGHACQLEQVYNENAKRGHVSPMLHPCSCSYTCVVDANGNVSETGGEKSTGCKSYCSKDGRKCGCHPEEACEVSKGSARFDMNHDMTAMARR